MRPYVGAEVRWPSIIGDSELTGIVKSVNYQNRKVCVITEDDKSTEVHFESLRPANNFRNFLHLIDEWDIHYDKSDDPKVYEVGKDTEQMLLKMFLSMNVRDKLQVEKMLLIKQLSR